MMDGQLKPPSGGPGGLALVLLAVTAAIILYAAFIGRVHW